MGEEIKRAVGKAAKLIKRILWSKLKLVLIGFLIIAIVAAIIVNIWNEFTRIRIRQAGEAAQIIRGQVRFENGEIIIDDEVYDEIREQFRRRGIRSHMDNRELLMAMVQAEVLTTFPRTQIQEETGGLQGSVVIARQDTDENRRFVF